MTGKPRRDDYSARERAADLAIRRARMDKGWTQEDLAAAMRMKGFGWRQSTVALVEAGKRRLGLQEAAALADALGVERGAYWRQYDDGDPH